jgi:hypothetical protein
MHEPQPLALHRAETVSIGSGSPLGLFLDFQLRQQARARN